MADARTPTITFRADGAIGGDATFIDPGHAELMASSATKEVHCLTPERLFDVTWITHVDYFSLDVEGAELMILELLFRCCVPTH